MKEIKNPDITENSLQKTLKPLKNLISSNILTPIFMKTLFAICIFTGLSLCYFSISTKWRLNCPECENIHVRTLFTNNPSRSEDKTDISHILFGIGGSAETWGRRRHYSELWWKPNVTRGYVWLDEEPDNKTDGSAPPYRLSEDTSGFRYTNLYGSRSAVRIARIVKESFELGLENVRWFVMGDDDTVFFTENLVNVLNKYDHREMFYIGTNSESVDQDVVHSYSMAYGGGGFAISYPLAVELVKILDGCIDRYAEMYGSDQKIGSCVNEIGVPVTREPGFHQVDIRGNPYGLLSAHPLAPLVSLHHLDYVQPLFPRTSRVASIKKLMNAYKSDPSRALQHTFCHDFTRNWSISLSWGYNLQVYPFLLSGKDLNTPLQTFLTWTWKESPFTFDTRVMSMEPCERPLVHYFDDVEEIEGGSSTVSMYKRKSLHTRQCNQQYYDSAYSVKGFHVSAPIFDPHLWNKAPRRQCCEVMNGSAEDGIVQVRIRGCNQGESVTLP